MLAQHVPSLRINSLYQKIKICADEADKDSDDDSDVEPITRFRSVPSDQSALQAMLTQPVGAWPGIKDEDAEDHNGEYGEEAHSWDRGHTHILYP